MALKSDLTINASKLDPSQISEKTRQFNDHLMKVMKDCPRWYEVGAPTFRQMREAGQTPLPGLSLEPSAVPFSISSRDGPDRKIPCRILRPRNNATPKALFYHIHGGGWVTGSEYEQDGMLQRFADGADLLVLSVGYRLSPEHPSPAAQEDCLDVGEWLVDRAEEEFGVKMRFLGGESAGAHLSALTLMRLLETRPGFGFDGVVLSYGGFNLTREGMPQVHLFDLPLVLDREIMHNYLKAYLGDMSPEDRRDPSISPFYADLSKMKLPPAIFPCGTLDLLLDDSIMMSTKWAMTGVESILKLYPGAPHGFLLFAPGLTETTQDALDDIFAFINDKLGDASRT